MNHLVVVAHPREQSFTMDVARLAADELTTRGHIVNLRDLYRMNFNPVASAEDIACMKTGRIAPDVAIEMELIKAADVITFVHPIWWIGLPAIIKGYVDRVFALGFAYGYGPNGVRGSLAGKRAMIITSSGSTQEEFDSSGKMASIQIAQDFGTMQFCAMDVIEHIHLAPLGSRSTPGMVEGYKQRVRAAIQNNF